MSELLNYFAYGSNMSYHRLRQRISNIEKLCCAVLQQHSLRFHKPGSVDQSGKCDAFWTGNDSDNVHGVVYKISHQQKERLDHFEGLGKGYEIKEIDIWTPTGFVHAFAYIATMVDNNLKPFDWYKQHVIEGARENNLPAEYIQQIEKIISIPDPDLERHQRELLIHNRIKRK